MTEKSNQPKMGFLFDEPISWGHHLHCKFYSYSLQINISFHLRCRLFFFHIFLYITMLAFVHFLNVSKLNKLVIFYDLNKILVTCFVVVCGQCGQYLYRLVASTLRTMPRLKYMEKYTALFVLSIIVPALTISTFPYFSSFLFLYSNEYPLKLFSNRIYWLYISLIVAKQSIPMPIAATNPTAYNSNSIIGEMWRIP